jgi:hypothetical protein
VEVAVFFVADDFAAGVADKGYLFPVMVVNSSVLEDWSLYFALSCTAKS